MSYKEEYQKLKRSYDAVVQNIADVKARQKVAKAELVKVTKRLRELTKGHDPQGVLDDLEKEIETRLEMIRDKVAKFETFVDESPSSVSEEDILEGIDL